MNTLGYEIVAMLPMQVGKGKIEEGKANTRAVGDEARIREKENSFVGVKAFQNTPEHLAEKARIKAEMKARAEQRDNDNVRH